MRAAPVAKGRIGRGCAKCEPQVFRAAGQFEPSMTGWGEETNHPSLDGARLGTNPQTSVLLNLLAQHGQCIHGNAPQGACIEGAEVVAFGVVEEDLQQVGKQLPELR